MSLEARIFRLRRLVSKFCKRLCLSGCSAGAAFLSIALCCNSGVMILFNKNRDLALQPKSLSGLTSRSSNSVEEVQIRLHKRLLVHGKQALRFSGMLPWPIEQRKLIANLI